MSSSGETTKIQIEHRKLRKKGYKTYYLAYMIGLCLLYVMYDPTFAFNSSRVNIIFGAVALILLIIGGWYFSLIFGSLLIIDKYKQTGGSGGGPPDPPDPYFIIIFFASISILAFWLLLTLEQKKPDIYDLATLWSAVYGTISGTVGLLKTLKK
jgi:hypothetical protein